MSSNAVGSSKETLSVLRTFALGAGLVAVIASIIACVCIVVGFVGSFLVDSGFITFERLTSLPSVIAVVIIASTILTTIICLGVYCTLVRPLRRMTLAMGHLAEGDFGYRVETGGRFNLREIHDFERSFNIAAAELAGTEMMRASFISDFSHEFRTPINSMSGFAQLLMEDDITDEERREYAGIIFEESQRLSGLSERILLLSKVEAATILPDKQDVNIAEQLRRNVALLESSLREKNLMVDLSLDEAHIEGNEDYLSQLWLNLIGNAIKFSPEGGRVSIALYGGHGAEASQAKNSDMVVWISDEGCGMDSDTQARIFDRFYQGDSSHAAAGAGLGLSLCKRIVELHGGNIEVTSAPGKGSVFEVRLPIAEGRRGRSQ